MTVIITKRTLRNPAIALAGLLALAGCMPPPATAPATAPTTSGSTATAASPYAPPPARATPPAPVITPPVEETPAPEPVPAAPSYSGPVDSRTGMRQSAVVSVSGNETRGYSVIYRPKNTEPASVDGAAAKLCGDAGVASSRSNGGGGASAMPGVNVMVVKCGAT